MFLEEEKARKDPTYYLKMLNPETRATLEQLYENPELNVSVQCVCVCVCVCVC